MFKLALYFAIGLVLHVIFVGAHIDPTNAWTWLWLVAWPVPLVLAAALGVLIAAVVGFWLGFIKGLIR